jgi:hypothetical protein
MKYITRDFHTSNTTKMPVICIYADQILKKKKQIQKLNSKNEKTKK